MTTTLLVIRHGRTAWNKDEHFRGRIDLPLDEVGQQQAQAVAGRLAAEYQPAAILASPLQRARQTAAAIGHALGQPVEVDEGLLDLDFGDFSGLSAVEAQAQLPEFYQAWLSVPHTLRFPHGESLDDVGQRLNEVLARLIETYPARQVVLVTHEAVGQILLCRLLRIHNGHFRHFQIDPASLTVCDLASSRATLVTINDTCHLKQLAEG